AVPEFPGRETLRSPTRSPPPREPDDPERPPPMFDEPERVPPVREDALPAPARLLLARNESLAPAERDCRVWLNSPRVWPPNLLAVPLSPYGAPPRCEGLCCQFDPPPFAWAPPRPPCPRFPCPRSPCP